MGTCKLCDADIEIGDEIVSIQVGTATTTSIVEYHADYVREDTVHRECMERILKDWRSEYVSYLSPPPSILEFIHQFAPIDISDSESLEEE